ncbi:hypothetical protein CEXT_152541 [Caerostris extrusa]|uniref:Uncharacterized protein n=1 Tax=Caerostris extrusa TaxID=172846 RepID=A0AAV4Q5P3_CAEEX|nr:hypothetical protein CEXT_152541 [Caerostris extrusa]
MNLSELPNHLIHNKPNKNSITGMHKTSIHIPPAQKASIEIYHPDSNRSAGQYSPGFIKDITRSRSQFRIQMRNYYRIFRSAKLKETIIELHRRPARRICIWTNITLVPFNRERGALHKPSSIFRHRMSTKASIRNPPLPFQVKPGSILPRVHQGYHEEQKSIPNTNANYCRIFRSAKLKKPPSDVEHGGYE